MPAKKGRELGGLSDDDLMRAQDAKAEAVLLARWRDRFTAFFCSKIPEHEADDLVQKALEVVTAWGRREDPERGRFRAFAYGVARRLLLQFCSARARGRVFDPEVHSIEDLDPSLSRQLSLHRKVEWLRTALAELPLETQTLLELRYVQELTYAEIASIYAIPVGTATSRVRLAKEQLAARRKK